MDFNKIVKKLWVRGPILLIEDIRDVIDPLSGRGKIGDRDVYKTVYRLKSENRLIALRNGLYLLPEEDDMKLSSSQMIERYYWSIARAYIQREVGSEYVLSGWKSLEILLQDMSTPSTLIIYTRDTRKTIRISAGHTLELKSIQTGSGEKNLFPALKKLSHTVEVSGEKYKILSREAALLDSLLVQKWGVGPDAYLIRKFLARFSEDIDRNILGKLVSLRYISSINRLRSLSKEFGYEWLYRDCISVIRDEGAGCFISV